MDEMRKVLRSSSLSSREKGQSDSSSKNVVHNEQIRPSSLISGDSVSANDSAISFPVEKVVKKARVSETVECGNGAIANCHDKNTTRVGPTPPPDMPTEFKNRIREMGGTEPVLVIQKALFKSDVRDLEGRLSIPKNHIEEGFLTDEEERVLDSRRGRRFGEMPTLLIEPKLGECCILLRKYMMKKTALYVLMKPWQEVVKRNGLKKGMVVQVWSFRVDLKLVLALVIVGSNTNEGDGASDGHGASTSQTRNVKSLKKGDHANLDVDKDDKCFPDDLNSANDLFLLSPERNFGEERSEIEHVESSDDTFADADKYSSKVGKNQCGKKRKSVDCPKNIGDALTNGVKEEKGSPLISNSTDPFNDMAVSTMEIKVEEAMTGYEPVQSSKDAGFHDANANSDTENGAYKPAKGQRGRKRKKVESSGCNEDGGVGRKKVKDGAAQVTSRVLRSRTMPVSGSQKVVSNGLNVSTRPVGILTKKVKGRRGRPPKVRCQNGAPNKIRKKKMDGASEVINHDGQPKGEHTGKVSKSAEDGRSNKLATFTRKKLKTSKHHGKGEPGRREEKQLIREQIISMLKKAGWTFEYRPRLGKLYNDVVYVDPEGRGYWSVTLAYKKLKERVEDGTADDSAVSAFTPIPEDVFSRLFRVTKAKVEKNKKLKKQGKGVSKIEKGIPGKETSENRLAIQDTDGSKRKGKLNSVSGRGKNSLSVNLKGDTSESKHNFSSLPQQRGMAKSNSKVRQHRKPCALLARSSEKGSDSDRDGFVPYSGKRSLLSWMIDLGTVLPGGKVQYMNSRKTRVMLEGRITRDGIDCSCCNETVAIANFESHAGSKSRQPFGNMYLESGISLLQCLVDSLSKQEESDQVGLRFVEIADGDPNDDTCNICADGGDLICCDGCPSTFHQSCLDIQEFPTGDWHCVYCSCKFCGMVAQMTCQSDDTPVSELLKCLMCEEKFHQVCVEGKDVINVDPNSPSFCGRNCQELFERLQLLRGVKHDLEEGFSCTILQHSDVSHNSSLGDAPQKIECNSKLAVAFAIMDECFLPIVDQRSGINMIHNVVYSCGSNFRRLSYSGFYTAILERGDEIISAASIRFHGNQLAEMPFIGTRHMYRRQGMCRRLLNGIELALCSLDVEKLVIPAISELRQTWTSVFGFKSLEESKRQDMRCMSMIVFPGTDMLQKPLSKDHFPDRNLIPALVVKSAARKNENQALHDGLNHSALGCSDGSDANASPEVIIHHSRGINDDSNLYITDGSLNDETDTASGRSNLPVVADNETSATHPSHTINELVASSEGSRTPEPNRQLLHEERNRCKDAQSGSIAVLPGQISVGPNSELNQQSVCGLESQSSIVSQFGSYATTLAMENSKDAVACEHTTEVKSLKQDCTMHDSAEIVTSCHDADLVHESNVPGSKILCQGSEADEIQLPHNSHLIVAETTSPSHEGGQDVANTSIPDDGNRNSSCQGNVFGSLETNMVTSADGMQLQSSEGFHDATTGPNSQACCKSSGGHKLLELPSDVSNDDISGVEASSLTRPDLLRRKTSDEITGNNNHDLKEVGSSTGILCDSKTFGNVSSCPDVTRLCTSSSCSACEVPQAGRILKSGNLC